MFCNNFVTRYFRPFYSMKSKEKLDGLNQKQFGKLGQDVSQEEGLDQPFEYYGSSPEEYFIVAR